MKSDLIKPIPVTKPLTKWQEWREIVFFAFLLTVSSIFIWHVPATQPALPLLLLCCGLLLDILSLIARISTAITGKYSSGFFLFGLIFYFWAWVSYSHPVFFGDSSNLIGLWLRKLPDIFCMAILHLLIHTNFSSRKNQPKDEKADADKPRT